MSVETLEPSTLSSRWKALKTAEPQLRIRDAAARLSTSEASLLSLLLGRGVRRLRCEPSAILPRLEALGSLMALTRNNGAVHERHGVYANVQVQGNVGLIANADIDLRLDFSVWTQAYAEVRPHEGRTLRSLQFFDASGTAIHKIYLENEASAGLWEDLVASFEHADQVTPFEYTFVETSRQPVAELDADAGKALLEAWEGLKEPHYFHGLLRKQKATRHQAFAAVEGRFTRRVTPGSLRTILGVASNDAIPIMIFVANPGAVQIHTGSVTKILPMGSWINVLDPEFNLHVDLALVSEAWVVSKPSPDGPVTSLEYLAANGDLVVQLFGKRNPGTPELAAWKAAVEDL